MTRARAVVGLTIVVGACVAACSIDPDVEVESRNRSATTPDTPDTGSGTSTTEPPVTSEPPSEDRDPAESDDQPPLVDPDPGTDDTFQLTAGEFTLSVSLRRTVAPAPPGGYDGFAGAVVTADGAVVAHGFDDVATANAPERSALWRSNDVEVWERVGESVGAPDGQQSIVGIVESGDMLTAFANGLSLSGATGDGGSPIFEFDAISRHDSVDGGTSWTRSEVWPDAFARLVESDGQPVLVGASDLATNRPLGSSFVELDAEPDRFQRYVTDLSSVGSSDTGGLPTAGTRSGDVVVAVGSTTASDPDRADDVSFNEQLLGLGPLDVGVWRSENGGRNWEAQRADPLRGRAGAQSAFDVIDVGGALWMLVADQDVEGATIELYSSTDGGASWSEATLDADVGPGRVPGDILVPLFAGAHLAEIDGAILVTVNAVSLGGAIPRVQSILSLFDPSTGAADTGSVTDVLEVEQIESIVTYGSAWIGLGRRERPPSDVSDLQAVDIRLDRASTPEPADGGSDTAARVEPAGR